MTFTVLLVDDNPVQATTRQAVLSSAGNLVYVAENASRALALLEDPAIGGKIRLVITDHVMPMMNGQQFVATLREQFPTLPVLVLSGLPDVEDEYSGLNVFFRLKPVTPEELIRLTELLCQDTLRRTA